MCGSKMISETCLACLTLPKEEHFLLMANDHQNQPIKVLEQSQVSPPPASVPPTTLPLSFFDVPWLYSHPIQRIFFFDFPYPTHYFLQTLLPSLKHSLSLTLQHFFPFAANLVFPPNPDHHHPYILYRDGDSLPFTVAESTARFFSLVSDSPTHVSELHPLVPVLSSPLTLEDGTRLVLIMAIQVTVLPNSGLCIGITFNHIAGDGRAFHHFIKFWASVCRAKGDLGSLKCSLPLPSHNRNIIQDPKGLKLVYLKELMKLELKSKESGDLSHNVSGNDKVRATFVLSRDQIEKIKKWVSIRCTSNNGPVTPHISTFVVTCSLMWVAVIRSEESQDNNVAAHSLDEPCNLIFLADCRNYPEFSIPSTYFGNCLVHSVSSLKRGQLVGENGFVEAVNAIESQVRGRKSDPMRGAETMMSDLKRLFYSGEPVLSIAGSPKLGVYETDFGWGKPKKSEVVHIEFSGSMSLSDGRHSEVAIEIWVALRRNQMNIFAAILEEQLGNI